MAKGKRGRTRQNFIKRFFSVLGPGLITGAADDDPSGIATYSIAGAQLGTSLLWTAFITWPLMAPVQMMCARILSGMADAAEMLTRLNSHYFVGLFGVIIAFATIRFRCYQIANVLKWLAATLFAYVHYRDHASARLDHNRARHLRSKLAERS